MKGTLDFNSSALRCTVQKGVDDFGERRLALADDAATAVSSILWTAARRRAAPVSEFAEVMALIPEPWRRESPTPDAARSDAFTSRPRPFCSLPEDEVLSTSNVFGILSTRNFKELPACPARQGRGTGEIRVRASIHTPGASRQALCRREIAPTFPAAGIKVEVLRRRVELRAGTRNILVRERRSRRRPQRR